MPNSRPQMLTLHRSPPTPLLGIYSLYMVDVEQIKRNAYFDLFNELITAVGGKIGSELGSATTTNADYT